MNPSNATSPTGSPNNASNIPSLRLRARPGIHLLRRGFLSTQGTNRTTRSDDRFPELDRSRFHRAESTKKGPSEPTRPPKVHLLFERVDSRSPTYCPRCCKEQPVKRSAQGLNILPAGLWVQGIPRSLASDQRFKIKIDDVFWNLKRAFRMRSGVHTSLVGFKNDYGQRPKDGDKMHQAHR
jgi:hypothetical protein